ncbi:DNA-binding protein [Castellaniella sp. MT123]|uniref:helix-turn-helix transcriptional regulator n=1 Tax=Castellaniella sp. MT123 TaxID=3140381 RepID=UPI0031F379DC
MLELSEQTIYNRICTGGNLPTFFRLGRLVRFRQGDVEVWLGQQAQRRSVPVESPVKVPPRRGRPTKAEQVRRRQMAVLR